MDLVLPLHDDGPGGELGYLGIITFSDVLELSQDWFGHRAYFVYLWYTYWQAVGEDYT